MRLLMLPRYGSLGASSRLRMMQYVPALSAAGMQVDVAPMLDDAYVRGLYAGAVPKAVVAAAYARRLRRLCTMNRYDLVWLQREACPWLPGWLELALLGRSTPLAVDYDDAVFHRYDAHASPLVRALLGRKIDRVMGHADLVTAGNDYLAARARAAGSPRVEWLPTVVDMERYREAAPLRTARPLVVGWIGSPATAHYLGEVADALRPMHESGLIRCIAVGANPDQVAGTPFSAREWREETEAEELRGFDVGIMPLRDDAWERGKCGYKLIQYMASGLPVVASPVGVNTQIVEAGGNGLLAEGSGQWAAAIAQLAGDPDLRRRMGEAGRRRVELGYSVQAQAGRLIDMLQRLARREGRACAES